MPCLTFLLISINSVPQCITQQNPRGGGHSTPTIQYILMHTHYIHVYVYIYIENKAIINLYKRTCSDAANV